LPYRIGRERETTKEKDGNEKMKKYKLTPEHEKQLKPWADKWIKNAMSTDPMTEVDREICRKAVIGLYQAADLDPPPLNRIVFVSSPFIMRFAGGFAAAIWYLRKNKFLNTRAATDAATDAATLDATDAATDAATYDATYDATRAATYDATYDATRDATDAATLDATSDATYDATDKNKWYSFPIPVMHQLSKALGLGVLGIKCAEYAYRMWNGGNQYSGWVSLLTFFRHVAELKIDYSKFDHYEKLTTHSGPRIMHEKFCIISDRPKTLKVNERNQPHCVDGPFCEWRDGSKLWALNGIRVPQWVVMTPASEIKKEMIVGEKNADVRRELIRRIGVEKLTEILDYQVLDSMDEYQLISFDIGDGRVRPYLKMTCPSTKLMHLEGVLPEITTVKKALAYKFKVKEWKRPLQEG
jgi:hypothetical protein